jgi:hypothetical protein
VVLHRLTLQDCHPVREDWFDLFWIQSTIDR